MIEQNYCVYVHTNKINGKKYVGITRRDPEKRWLNGRGYIGCNAFYAAIKKYGWLGFYHDILSTGLTKSDAENMEKQLIKIFKTTQRKYGYNIMFGGSVASSGSWTPEMRKHQSEIKTGKTGWDASHLCLVDQYDVHHNFIKTYPSLSEAGREAGVSKSAIFKAITDVVSYTAGGFYWSYHGKEPKWGVHKTRPVAQIDIITGNIINIFVSAGEACKYTGLDTTTIKKYCTIQSICAKKFIWRYIDACVVSGHIIDKQTFKEVGIDEAANLLIILNNN